MKNAHTGTSKKHYDAIVIGSGGAIGSATTYQLAKRGADVLGIERFKPPHNKGSSHGETRIQRIFSAEHPLYTDTARRSIEILREVENEETIRKELQTHQDGIHHKLFHETGVLCIGDPNVTESNFGNNAGGFHRDTIDVAKRHQEGEDYALLTAQEVRDRYPQFFLEDHETGCLDIKGGFTFPERVIDAQLQLAKNHGATLQHETEITSVNPDGRVVTLKTKDGQEFVAEHVVLAVGAWTKRFLTEYKELFKVCRNVLHWFEVENPEDFSMNSSMPHDGCPTYIRQVPGNVFYGFPMIDNMVKIATNNHKEDTDDMDDIDRIVTSEEVTSFHEHIRPWMPGVHTYVRSATCAYTLCNNDPHAVVGPDPRYHGKIYFGGPGGGHSFKHSPAFGEQLAQMIWNRKNDIDIVPLYPSRFIKTT